MLAIILSIIRTVINILIGIGLLTIPNLGQKMS